MNRFFRKIVAEPLCQEQVLLPRPCALWKLNSFLPHLLSYCKNSSKIEKVIILRKFLRGATEGADQGYHNCLLDIDSIVFIDFFFSTALKTAYGGFPKVLVTMLLGIFPISKKKKSLLPSHCLGEEPNPEANQ